MDLRLITLFLFTLVFASCHEDAVVVPEPYQPTSAYDAYRHGLVELGLGNSSLAKAWRSASDQSLNTPTYVQLPYTEALYFDDLKPQAYSYRMKTRRGQKITTTLKKHSDTDANVFIDLYQVSLDTMIPYIHVATADSSWTLGFEPQVDGDFILRLQPELLKAGRYVLEIKEVPSFDFPMSGRTETAILSIFGAERDAGKRIHEGNDIFASRHVPIIAATSGTISYAGERGLGGKQIYIKDEQRNLKVYFAHLDSVYVAIGDEVIRGDTIGTNGNSGNAKTTNPHLHFGIYADTGAIDPYHYIVPNRRSHRTIKADPKWVGHMVRTKNKAYFDHIDERYRNRRDSVSIHTIMYVAAAWSRSYRVRLPDGRDGYVRSGDLTRIDDTPYKKRKADKDFTIIRSLSDSMVDGVILTNESYNILGRFGTDEYVEHDDIRGWKVK